MNSNLEQKLRALQALPGEDDQEISFEQFAHAMGATQNHKKSGYFQTMSQDSAFSGLALFEENDEIVGMQNSPEAKEWFLDRVQAVGYDYDVNVAYQLRIVGELTEDVDLIDLHAITDDFPATQRSAIRRGILNAAESSQEISPYVKRKRRWRNLIKTGLTAEWFEEYLKSQEYLSLVDSL